MGASLADPTGKKDEKSTKKKSSVQQFRSVLPLIKELIRPRRGLLAFSFLLLLIGRVSGLVLPLSTKFLIDNVINQHRPELLKAIVGSVLAATMIQGLTS